MPTTAGQEAATVSTEVATKQAVALEVLVLPPSPSASASAADAVPPSAAEADR
jgi:hypothetical protein